MTYRPLILCLAGALLAGCVESPPPEAPREEDRQLERAVQEPLDKARAVEQQMRDARREQDEKLREEGG
jgi:hypothetical protein